MVDTGSMVQRVLVLKEHLSCTQDPEKEGRSLQNDRKQLSDVFKVVCVRKPRELLSLLDMFNLLSVEGVILVTEALEGLQDLEISLDILVETGVGKTVNSFRKHATVGDLAKSLISHWKKLIPQENGSKPRHSKHTTRNEKGSSNGKIRKLRSKEIRHMSQAPESSGNVTTSSSDKQNNEQGSGGEQRREECGSVRGCESKAKCNDTCKASPGGQETITLKYTRKGSDGREETSEKHGFSLAVKKEKILAAAHKEDFLALEGGKSGKIPSTKQVGTEATGMLKSSSRSKGPVKPHSRNDFEPPATSFESYLNYDQPSGRRKRKSTDRQPVNGNRSAASRKSLSTTPEKGEGKQLNLDDDWEAPMKKAKISLQDLLNTPLPKDLPELLISSPPYVAEFKAPPVAETPKPESVPFIGQRRHSKVQVNSGSKMISLPKMLTLYEQCIRVLQNSIDLLHEVGGVPFEILEPVLTRCTPQQLLRIEDCNPTFVEESDHLWKIHCQKHFRNEHPLQYESWREMYLRLFNQREAKLKSLTKNILSAQADKSKGCQVKMAFIHGMTKSPGSLRCHQAICRTSGTLMQFQSKNGPSLRVKKPPKIHFLKSQSRSGPFNPLLPTVGPSAETALARLPCLCITGHSMQQECLNLSKEVSECRHASKWEDQSVLSLP